jgi:hypothetical protein
MLMSTLVLLVGGFVLYLGAVRLGRLGDSNAAGWLQIVAGTVLAAVGTWRLVAAIMVVALR